MTLNRTANGKLEVLNLLSFEASFLGLGPSLGRINFESKKKTAFHVTRVS